MDAFCSSYHWSVREVLDLTYPQIVLLSHASHVNRKRAGLDKIGKNSESHASGPLEDYRVDGTPKWHGKNIDELTSDEYNAYVAEAGL